MDSKAWRNLFGTSALQPYQNIRGLALKVAFNSSISAILCNILALSWSCCFQDDEYDWNTNQIAQRSSGVSPQTQHDYNTGKCRAKDLGQNHVITLEITSGQVYRGKLIEGTIP